MHIPTLKSNALLSGLKTFYPKFHRMEWVYTDFILGVVIRVDVCLFYDRESCVSMVER
jgi:hypothetical protein